jgi:predicted RNase H-like nuclease (RuvC/YqgF family)
VSPPQPVIRKMHGKGEYREYRRVKAKRNRVKDKNRNERLLKLEEELLKQNKRLSTQVNELKNEVLSLKTEILSHAFCDNHVITQYINSQAAHL